MRSPENVAEQIKKCIPKEREDLHERINWLINEFLYKAPEQANYCWGALSEYVNENLVAGEDPLTTGWKIKAVAILCDKTEKQILAEIAAEKADPKKAFIDRMVKSGMTEKDAEDHWRSMNLQVDDD